MKTIKLRSTDLKQTKVKCNFPYEHVFIKKVLHVPTGLFAIGNHVKGKQSSKGYRDLRNDLVIIVEQKADGLLGNHYLHSLIECTNAIDYTGINNIIAEAVYSKLKKAVEFNTEKVSDG